MGKHSGRFKWSKYSKHKGNLKDYWCHPGRVWDRHRAAMCDRCGGTGRWRYDENHSQPCPDCCRHDQGVWLLTFEYGDPGMWCCKAGCGAKWAGIVDYQKSSDLC